MPGDVQTSEGMHNQRGNTHCREDDVNGPYCMHGTDNMQSEHGVQERGDHMHSPHDTHSRDVPQHGGGVQD